MTTKKLSQTQVRELAWKVKERTENLYEARKICCAEAVIATLNETFGGGLPYELAVRLGSGFCHGMGGAGCSCGALTGAEVVLGLFMGPTADGGMKKKEFGAVAKEMHDRFKERNVATCCRILCKRRKEKKGPSCQELTGCGAELVTELLLAHRPELAERVNNDFLVARDSKVAGMVKKMLGG